METEDLEILKQEIIRMSERYSKDKETRRAYTDGIKAISIMIWHALEECCQIELLGKVDDLAEVCFMEFDE